MEKAELEAKLRGKIGSEIGAIRNSGMAPAIVYGKGIKNLMVSIELKKLEKTIGGEAGRNIIISLKVAEGDKVKTIPVLTQDIQRDPLTSRIIHVDFLRVDMEKKIKTRVPLELVGISIGVKEEEGILIHGLREVEVKCLPTDIPDKLTIDVSPLKIGDSLHVSDIKASKDIEIVSAGTETIVHISAPAKEEELAPAPTISAAEVPSEKGAPALAVEGAPAEGKKAEKGAPGAGPSAAAPGKAAAPAATGKAAAPAAPGKAPAPAAPASGKQPEKK